MIVIVHTDSPQRPEGRFQITCGITSLPSAAAIFCFLWGLLHGFLLLWRCCVIFWAGSPVLPCCFRSHTYRKRQRGIL